MPNRSKATTETRTAAEAPEVKSSSLVVGPDELRAKVLPLLIPYEAIELERFAKGLGSTDSNLRRGINKYIAVLELFGLAAVDKRILLTHRGLRYRNSTLPRSAQAALRPVWTEPGVPSTIYKAVSQSQKCARSEFASRLRALSREVEATFWLDWLVDSGMGVLEGDEITFTSLPSALIYSDTEIRRHREILYRDLASLTNPSLAGRGDCYHTDLAALHSAFKKADPDKAEPYMARLVEAAFRRLGVIVQTTNGPLDSGSGLHFGKEGDDAIGFFFNPPAAASEEFYGFAIPMELKRTKSDKKAVGQALMVDGRVQKFYQAVQTAPITISDSETYEDKVARDYANANRVLHLPLDAIVKTAQEQMDRFCNKRALITFSDLWQTITTFRDQGYMEPTTDEWVKSFSKACDARPE
jgi:hypothetical protein